MLHSLSQSLPLIVVSTSMRFSAIIPAALAAGPLAVSAAGTLGYALGSRLTDGTCKQTTDYEADFAVLKEISSIFRTYSAVDGAISSLPCQVAAQILPAAASSGVKIILGLWPDTEESFNTDRAALQAAVPAYPDSVYAITVGSETLYRGNFTGPELLDRINIIKGDHPSVKVGTADSWNKYTDGTADALITGGVNLLLVNAFGYWQAQEISNATATYLDDLQQAFGHIQSLAGSTTSIEIWNGETGWPTTGGDNYGAAIAGTDNAATFFKDGVCAALDWGFNVFYFEAFDEPWKPKSAGLSGQLGDETHWGAFTDQRVAKFPLTC